MQNQEAEKEEPQINSNPEESQNRLILDGALNNLASVLGEDFIPVLHRLGLFARDNTAVFLGFVSQLDSLINFKTPENEGINNHKINQDVNS
jgi:hypothetical protein